MLSAPPSTTHAAPTREIPELVALLRDLMGQRQLHAVFQPLIDLRTGAVFGYEGLIRGPSNSPLHSPAMLFGVAERADLFQPLEQLCREVVIAAFATQNLPGQLFLNVSPFSLMQPDYRNGTTLQALAASELCPSRVIIELTENQPVYDYELLRSAVSHYREMGFSIAIDDLGEGFSSLRLWSELRPEFVKIDRHFVHDLHQDPLKLQFIRSIQQIADNAGSRVIAEGIETLAELRVVRDLGLTLGQGYVFARPSPQPPREVPTEPSLLLRGHAHPRRQAAPGTLGTGKLLQAVIPATPNQTVNAVYHRFRSHPQLMAIPVVEHERPIGLLQRHALIETLSRPFNHELYDKRSCITLMDRHPLIVDEHLPLPELSARVTSTHRDALTDGFIIIRDGRYLGMGSGHDLMREITERQIAAARHANPITGLPGNVPINEEMERLLAEQRPFQACYADIDHFKPFNDTYGYRLGDEVIQLTGHLLQGIVGAACDFLGHVGGDDFVLLLQSSDWEARCRQALTEFRDRLWPLLLPEHRDAGGYRSQDRQGETRFHALPGLSIGVVPVRPGRFQSHHEIAQAMTEAKAQAKRRAQNASSLFVDRRQHV